MTAKSGSASSNSYLADGNVLRAAARYGTLVPDAEEPFDVFPDSPDTPAGLALRTGQPAIIRGRAGLVARFPVLSDIPFGDLSVLVAPLIIGKHKLGVLTVTVAGSERVDERTQLAFLTRLADVTAQALQRARASTAAEQANDRLRFLAEASLLLSSTLEPKIVLADLTRLVVPRLADWRSLSLLDNGQLQPVAIAHTDPERSAGRGD